MKLKGKEKKKEGKERKRLRRILLSKGGKVERKCLKTEKEEMEKRERKCRKERKWISLIMSKGVKVKKKVV